MNDLIVQNTGKLAKIDACPDFASKQSCQKQQQCFECFFNY